MHLKKLTRCLSTIDRTYREIMAFTDLTVGSWVGLANWQIPEDKDRVILAWFNGKITEIKPKSPDCVKVKVHFGSDDKDNNTPWDLEASDFVKKTKKLEFAPEYVKERAQKTRGLDVALAWRKYGVAPNMAVDHIRELSLDEVTHIIPTVIPKERYQKMHNLELANMKELIKLWDGKGPMLKKFRKPIPPEPETRKPKKRNVEDDSADEARDSKISRAEQNARMVLLEQTNAALKRKIEMLEANQRSAYENTNTQVARVVQDRKAKMFAPVRYIEGIFTCTLDVHHKMHEGVRTGNNTFHPFSNVQRCMRYMHTDNERVLCASAKLVYHSGYADDDMFYHKSNATRVPLAIMEIDSVISQYVSNVEGRMTLLDAHKRWANYKTCDACLKDIRTTDMEFIKLEKVKPHISDTCSICLIRSSGNRKTGGVAPICTKCLDLIAKNGGGGGGGDNRSYAFTPLRYRFPWLSFTTNDNNQWAHLFSTLSHQSTSAALANTLRGPDTLLRIDVIEKRTKIWAAIEEDGGQNYGGHNNYSHYTVDGEFKRLEDVIKILLDNGDKVLVIRMVPLGECKTPRNKTYQLDKGWRLIIARMWVCWFVKQVLIGAPLPKATVVYLYYDSENKHLAKAKSLTRAGEVQIIQAYTFPQDMVPNGEDDFDWRYCVHPIEGYLINKIAVQAGLFKMTVRDMIV